MNQDLLERTDYEASTTIQQLLDQYRSTSSCQIHRTEMYHWRIAKECRTPKGNGRTLHHVRGGSSL